MKRMNRKLVRPVADLFAILTVCGFANFFYAHSYRNLASAVGFALIAYGTYKVSQASASVLSYCGMLFGLGIFLATLLVDYVW